MTDERGVRQNAKKRVGVLTRLSRAFALQIAIISVATIGGVIATARIIEDVLTRQALNGEAEHYWSLYRENPQQPLPHTDNMRGYLAVNGNVDALPPELRSQEPGYRRVTIGGHKPILHVSDNGNARLYLVFAEAQVSDLAFYFGVAPLSIVLLLLYGLAWFTYRMSQRAVSPMVQLADRLERSKLSFEKGVRLPLADLRTDADAEVAVMIDALEAFTARLNSFVERERNFTRDASHELRTPIAVLNGSLDLLAREPNRPETERATLARMRRTVTDMRALIDTLLLLAREDELAVPREPVIVNEVVRVEVNEQRELAAATSNDVHVSDDDTLEVRAPAKVIAILFGNLLRNALTYTKNGRVDVTVTRDSVRVADTGIGMTAQEVERAFEPFFRAEHGDSGDVSGHGLGLAIVQRLANQFGWHVHVTSAPGQGTTVAVRFA
jgi:signal transduction histidine kinase